MYGVWFEIGHVAGRSKRYNHDLYGRRTRHVHNHDIISGVADEYTNG